MLPCLSFVPYSPHPLCAFSDLKIKVLTQSEIQLIFSHGLDNDRDIQRHFIF
ncbi:hypothetical protein COO91_03798 [Nostoc flagelliforme CCNUN1]|uniref:Uncharacterized protein n=1 Tax=Nostoc flagelliforme CCNUN1 TaxID=2038116 RepID=A0A2K8SQW6_9NOSO|nr:hypothetical protein COO91_03798 [Nostoc flagelliforme CCNUN1]